MTMPQDTLDRIAEQLCAELGQDRLSGYDRTCILSALSAVRAEGTPGKAPAREEIRELMNDLNFAIDVTEPRDVILRRFADILERSPLWR